MFTEATLQQHTERVEDYNRFLRLATWDRIQPWVPWRNPDDPLGHHHDGKL